MKGMLYPVKSLPLYFYLKILRQTAGYSKQEVADWLGISSSAYAHYETERYEGMCLQYLNILESKYELTPNVLHLLPFVDISVLSYRPPLSPAENLAAFLIFYQDPDHENRYKGLSFFEKWCMFYCATCRNQKALLTMLCAAPQILPWFFEDC